MITAENLVEKRIIESSAFTAALSHASCGIGHPEKNLKEHIEQILAYIDGQQWGAYRTDLRFLALTHDLGKGRVVRNAAGGIIGKPHAQLSEEIAKEQGFTNDDRLLTLIRIHDKYFGFYKDATSKGRFREEKFRSTFENIDLNTLIRFNYADSNSRNKSSVQWFEDRLVALGMRTEKIYEREPCILQEGET